MMNSSKQKVPSMLRRQDAVHTLTGDPMHQQKTFPSGRNACVRVDALRQSRQRYPGGGLLRARRQYHVSRCISPSDRRFGTRLHRDCNAMCDAAKISPHVPSTLSLRSVGRR
jgi:hypothetical protein